MTKRDERPTQVAMIGCDNIEVASAYMLAKSNHVNEVLLVGPGNRTLAKDVRMLIHFTGYQDTARVSAVEIEDAARANIAVIASRVDRELGEPWVDHFRRAAAKVRADVRAFVDAGFAGVFLVTTKPIDIMAYFAQHESGVPYTRVIGLATDAVPGKWTENGQIGSATWCSGLCSNPAFLDNCDPVCPYFQTVAKNLTHTESGDKISGLATCVVSICEAILRDGKEMYPVSAMLNGEYDLHGLYMGTPCVLGRKGVEKILEREITPTDRDRIRAYAGQLRSLIREVSFPVDASLECPVMTAESYR